MSLKSRLKRLEKSRDAGPCGEDCPPVFWVHDDGWYGRPSDEGPPAPCPRCGRPPVLLHVVFDPDFFSNAEQLEALMK
jgi:hypothetical protein